MQMNGKYMNIYGGNICYVLYVAYNPVAGKQMVVCMHENSNVYTKNFALFEDDFKEFFVKL